MNFRAHRRSHVLCAFVFLGIIVLLANHVAFADDLVSVAFSGQYPSNWGLPQPPLISGPEAAATAANPLFGAANVWNNLELTNQGFQELVNPSWLNLMDSTGANSGVGLSITGTVAQAVMYGLIPNPDPLRSQYVAFNDNAQPQYPNMSDSISFTFTGLDPGASYAMCVYGARTNYDRTFNMTIQGSTLAVPSYNTTDNPLPGPDCTYFSHMVASAAGTITGTGVGIGSDQNLANEADWSGFQLARTPEPCSLVLLGAGLLGVIARKRL